MSVFETVVAWVKKLLKIETPPAPAAPVEKLVQAVVKPVKVKKASKKK